MQAHHPGRSLRTSKGAKKLCTFWQWGERAEFCCVLPCCWFVDCLFQSHELYATIKIQITVLIKGQLINCVETVGGPLISKHTIQQVGQPQTFPANSLTVGLCPSLLDADTAQIARDTGS